jgi:hypothetical protein
MLHPRFERVEQGRIVRLEPLDPLKIAKDHLAIRIGSAEEELLAYEPCIERDDDSAHRHNGPENKHVLREVAGGDSNVVAFPNAVDFVENVRDGLNALDTLPVGDPVVFLEPHGFPVSVGPRRSSSPLLILVSLT